MDQSATSQPVNGVSGGTAPVAYAATTYQPAVMVTAAPAVIGTLPSPTQPTLAFSTNPAQLAGQQQLAFPQVQQLHHQQQQQLQNFWANQMVEIEQTNDFKNQSLPLARIKKIMKADKDVRMISAEAPVVFAKACEMFILELTLRAWIHTEENKRRTLQKNDIAAAISRTDIFDFLVDIVPPRDDLKDDNLGIPRAGIPAIGAPTDSIPYYYVPPQHQVPGPGIIMGQNMNQTASAALYAAQQSRPVAYMWQQLQGQCQEQHPHQRHDVPDSD